MKTEEQLMDDYRKVLDSIASCTSDAQLESCERMADIIDKNYDYEAKGVVVRDLARQINKKRDEIRSKA